jgi:hypothetical protein
MKKTLYCVLFIFVALTSPVWAGVENVVLGEWISVERTKGGLGSTKTYTADGAVHATFGALVDFKYKLTGNKLTFSFPGADDIVQKIEIKGTKMILTFETTGDKQELTRIAGNPKAGIIGKWTGDHYTGQKQIMHFTTAKNCYLSVPMLSANGRYNVTGDFLTESFDEKGPKKWKWSIQDNVLILTDPSQGKSEKYMRKK